MVKEKLVNEIAEKIKKRFKAEKIILFGSYAWGTPSDDSDIDLFVVMDSDLRRDQRARQIQKIFSDRTFPLDVIVYTPQELQESLKIEPFFIKEILNRGNVLYG